MNRDEVIALAKEVGFVAYGEDAGEFRIPAPAFYSRLERFAAFVAAAENEACARVCEARFMGDLTREDMEAQRCADAIRARGNRET